MTPTNGNTGKSAEFIEDWQSEYNLIKEILSEANIARYLLAYQSGHRAATLRAAAAVKKAVEERWILASDQLPNDLEDVLVWEPQDGIQQTWFDSKYSGGISFFDKPIEENLLIKDFPDLKWMPLPPSPNK